MMSAAGLASGLWLWACLAALLLLPGAAALRMAGDRSRGLERAARALGLSVAVWPLLLLWTSRLGLRWTSPLAWLLIAAALVLALGPGTGSKPGRHRPPHRAGADRSPSRLDPTTLVLVAIWLIALGTRLLQARELAVPPWVDGYHHSLVTALILDRGGLPDDYRPYLQGLDFYYHFGFHALAAVASWLSGLELPRVVLALGQAINAATAATVYALALRLTRHRVPTLLAAALPASLFYLPAYFLSWGRYTQLTGLVLLPVAWLLLQEAVERAGWRPAALAALGSAGLLLVHYRVMAFFLVGALLILLPMLRQPRRMLRWLAAGLGGMLLAGPWILRNMARGLASQSSASEDWLIGSAEIARQVAQAPPDWLFTWGTNGFWIRLAGIGLLAGMWAGRRAAWALAAGLAICLLLVAPPIPSLSSSWLLPPFSLAISLYLPVALGLALLADLLAEILAGIPKQPTSEGRAPGDASDASQARRRPWPPSLPSALALGICLPVCILAWRQRAMVSPLDASPLQLGFYLLAAALIGLTAAAGQRPAPASPGALPAAAGGGRARRAAELGRSVIAPAAIVLACLAGARQMRGIVRDDTIIARQPDLAAAAWIAAETPADARFLIGATAWHLGTYRGLDGGYWLPLLADRSTSLPAALYSHGRAEDILRIGALAERASRGDALSDAGLSRLLEDAGAGWIYLGPSAEGHPDAFSAARLRRHPDLIERYAAGGAHVFQHRP